MKQIIYILILLSFTSCLVDEDEKTYKEDGRSQTFEVVNDKLIPTESDFAVLPKSYIHVYSHENKYIEGYGISLHKKSKMKDSIFFHLAFFSYSPPKMVSDSGFTPTYVRSNDNKYVQTKSQMLEMDIAIAGFIRDNNIKYLPLPSYIDSTQQQKGWCMIFPYKIKDKQKCLIIYELDTIFKKNVIKNKEEGLDRVKYPPLDSLYHFP